MLFVIIIIFIVYVSFETLKNYLYFQPNKDCSKYENNKDYENVFIDDIHGWLYESEEKNKIIVYFHGNAGNIGSRINIMEQWKNQGYSIFIFDYSGYGLSKGNPSVKTFYSNAEKVMDFILSFQKIENVVLYGESIGCSVVSYISSKYDVNKIILQSGFISMKEIGKDFLPSFLQWILYLINDFDTYKFLISYKGKCLILHSKEDEIVNFRHGKKLSEISSDFIEMQGSHNNSIYDIKEVIQFIEK